MESSIANIDKPDGWDGWGIRYAVSRVWMSIYVGGDKSTLVQVMAWCR